MAHTLPELSYDYSALEPHIDAKTMELHHSKHHAAYVAGLNAAEEQLAEARESGDFARIQHLELLVAFHGSGHYNHAVFWTNMGPDGGGEPTGELAEQIKKDFGSYEKFHAHFTKASAAIEGSGWGVLGWHPMAQKLEIYGSMNHQNQTQWGAIPVLMLDVWEHAYYLNYQNRRPDYIKAWWNVVNWDNAAKRLQDAQGAKMAKQL